MIEQGFILMGIGMGMVITFLSLMVIAMHISSAVITRHFPDKRGTGKDSNPPRSSKEDLSQIAAAIAITKSKQGKIL